MKPKVFIITINYHSEDHTIELLNSIKKLNYPNYKVIVVDNESTKDSLKKLKKQFPKTIIIQSKENVGWTGGCKLGADYALKKGADYIFLLNNDQILDKNVLNELVKTAESDKKIGFVSPTIYKYNQPEKIDTIGGYMNYWTGIATESKRNNKIQEVKSKNEYVDDCALLVKRSVIEKAGMHDPIYFLYYEDVDWNIKVRKSGFKIIHNPNAKVWHKIYGSSGGKKNPIPTFYLIRNRFIFMRKHISNLRFLLFLFLTLFIAPLQILLFIFKKQSNLIPAFAKGLYRGLKISLKNETSFNKSTC